MKPTKILILAFIVLLLAVFFIVQQPQAVYSSSPQGIKPTPVPTEPPVPAIVVRVGETELPATGQSRISSFLERLETLWAGIAPYSQKLSAPHGSYDASKLPDASAVTRIVIPNIHVDAPVVALPFVDKKWDIQKLTYEAGWLENTSLPGLGSNTVLAGHLTLKDYSSGPFRFLIYLQPGDEILVYTQQRVYRYAVQDQATLPANSSWVLKPTKSPQLTLITCSQWDEKTQTFKYRRVVFAALVESGSLQGETSPIR